MATPTNSLIVTVTTSDGSETVHTYPIPPDAQEMASFLDELTKEAVGAVSDPMRAVPFYYPTVLYRAAHIIKIQIEARGSADLVAQVQERAIGFRLES